MGPLAGAILCELIFARKEMRPASVSGFGSVVGVAAGMIVKVIVGVLMIGWLLVDLWVVR